MYAATLSPVAISLRAKAAVKPSVPTSRNWQGTRFGYKDIAEAIIEPSKVISDQYDSSF